MFRSCLKIEYTRKWLSRGRQAALRKGGEVSPALPQAVHITPSEVGRVQVFMFRTGVAGRKEKSRVCDWGDGGK